MNKNSQRLKLKKYELIIKKHIENFKKIVLKIISE